MTYSVPSYLLRINNLPDMVSSQVRLFADDCLLYRAITQLLMFLLYTNDIVIATLVRTSTTLTYVISLMTASCTYREISCDKEIQIQDEIKLQRDLTSLKTGPKLGRCNSMCRNATPSVSPEVSNWTRSTCTH